MTNVLHLLLEMLREFRVAHDHLLEVGHGRPTRATEELRGVLGSRAWPWLGFVGFELGAAVCACGNLPLVFTEAGEPRCKLHLQPSA